MGNRILNKIRPDSDKYFENYGREIEKKAATNLVKSTHQGSFPLHLSMKTCF